MRSYLDLCERVIDHGQWVTNKRTGKRCRTVIDASLVYDVSAYRVPVLTTKRTSWRPAIAEMLGYLRGYTSAAQFRELGCNTWNANANDNESWLANPHRTGPDDMGECYGAQLRRFHDRDGCPHDQLRKVMRDLRHGIDNRREILTFWNPAELDRGCLPACMHTYTFSILNGRLYLTSYQRSADLPLGVPFNMIQVAWLLLVMAQITGLKPGRAFHKMVNVHIYEDQIDIMREKQLNREPREAPYLLINPKIDGLRDLETWVTTHDFALAGYNPHPPISYPFSV